MNSYRPPLLSSIMHLYLRSGFSPHPSSAAKTSDLRFGFRSCPCLQVNNSSSAITITDEGRKALGEEMASDPSYGMGDCYKHEDRKVCQDLAQDDNDNSTFCKSEWCFVDPDNCDLVYSASKHFSPKRFFSYATCGSVDVLRGITRIEDLNGTVLKVGVNYNSGGLLGAYSEDGVHFEGPWSSWYGATVRLVRFAAETYGFQLNITNDLPFDNFKLGNFYGAGNTNFSQCVHATALGYLDMCVGQYTITTERALAADFIELTSEPVILLIKKDEQLTGFAYYTESVWRVFLPFDWTTWIFTIFFVMPVLGLFSLINHYDTEYFPIKETVTIIDENGEETEVEKRISILRHMGLATHDILIGTMVGTSFERSSNAGSMISNIGVTIFAVIITATYTANLASYFTIKATSTTVNNVEEALGAGYRFCASRTRAATFLRLYPHVPESVFVVDPVDLGGDGRPGFSCERCKGRTRALDMVDPVKANYDKSYCHAAMSDIGELDLQQSRGNHCDLFAVGPPLFTITSGIPVSREKRTVLTFLFHQLQNNGNYEEIMSAKRPTSTCVVVENVDPQDNDLQPLTIMDLSGLWSFVLIFGLVGVAVSMYTPQKKRTKPKRRRISKFFRKQTVGLEENKSSNERVRRNSI